MHTFIKTMHTFIKTMHTFINTMYTFINKIHTLSNTMHTPSNTMHTPSNTMHTLSNTMLTLSNTMYPNINKMISKILILEKYCNFFGIKNNLLKSINCLQDLILLNIFIFLNISELKYNDLSGKQIEKTVEKNRTSLIQEKMQNFYVLNLSDEIKELKEYSLNIQKNKIP